MRFEFHPEARVEYLEAIAWYEERQRGLGARLAVEIENAISRIIGAPTRWRKIEGDIRCCLTHIFPYGVLYSLETDYVLVLSIMHHSRRPGYWRHRVSE